MVIHVFSPSTLEIHYHSQLKPCFIETIETTKKRSSREPHAHASALPALLPLWVNPQALGYLPSVSARLRHPLTHNHLWQAPCSSLLPLLPLPISTWTPYCSSPWKGNQNRQIEPSTPSPGSNPPSPPTMVTLNSFLISCFCPFSLEQTILAPAPAILPKSLLSRPPITSMFMHQPQLRRQLAVQIGIPMCEPFPQDLPLLHTQLSISIPPEVSFVCLSLLVYFFISLTAK